MKFRRKSIFFCFVFLFSFLHVNLISFGLVQFAFPPNTHSFSFISDKCQERSCRQDYKQNRLRSNKFVYTLWTQRKSSTSKTLFSKLFESQNLSYTKINEKKSLCFLRGTATTTAHSIIIILKDGIRWQVSKLPCCDFRPARQTSLLRGCALLRRGRQFVIKVSIVRLVNWNDV